jgi:hypothetical protein
MQRRLLVLRLQLVGALLLAARTSASHARSEAHPQAQVGNPRSPALSAAVALRCSSTLANGCLVHLFDLCSSIHHLAIAAFCSFSPPTHTLYNVSFQLIQRNATQRNPTILSRALQIMSSTHLRTFKQQSQQATDGLPVRRLHKKSGKKSGKGETPATVSASVPTPAPAPTGSKGFPISTPIPVPPTSEPATANAVKNPLVTTNGGEEDGSENSIPVLKGSGPSGVYGESRPYDTIDLTANNPFVNQP